MTRTLWLLATGSVVLGCGDDGGNDGGGAGPDAGNQTQPICSAEELTQALAAAQPGDTVVVGSCEMTGSFVVGAGVTLAGLGPDQSKLIAEPSGIVLTLEPGEAQSTVRALTIESAGWTAIDASQNSAGSIALDALELDIALGAGITLSGPASASLSEVRIRGPLTADNEPVAGELNFSNTPYAGILASGGSVSMTDVELSGFAMAGAAFSDVELSWSGGRSDATYQHGVYLQGGSATIEDVEVSETLARSGYAYGLVSFEGAQLSASRLTVSRNEKFGIVQLDDTTALYQDLVAEDNGSSALWVQKAADVNIVGMNGFMGTNTMSAVVVRDTAKVSITDMLIEDTATVPHIVGMNVIEVGDGIQVFDSFAQLSIKDSRVSLNGRAGIVLEASDGNIPDGIFEGVTANAAIGGLGVVAQSSAAVIPAGDTWDQGVTREGETLNADTNHTERLVTTTEIVGMNGVVAPPTLVIEASP